MERLKNEANEKINEADKLQRQSTNMRSLYRKKRNQLETYELELRQLEEELEQHTREVHGIDNNDDQILMSNLGKKLSRSRTKIDMFCNSITKVKGNISECKLELNAILKDLVRCEQQMRSILCELDQLKDKLQKLEQLEWERNNWIAAAADIKNDTADSGSLSRYDVYKRAFSTGVTGWGVAALGALATPLIGPAGPLLAGVGATMFASGWLTCAGVTVYDAIVGNPKSYNKEQRRICGEYDELISNCKMTVNAAERVCMSCQQELVDMKCITTEMKLYAS